jgi:hypothetical protein
MKRYNTQHSSISNLQCDSYGYLDVAFQSCKDFQEKIRRNGARSFNVWLFLEQEFRKYYLSSSINRKPPKAVTIEQWFNDNHLSGSKMGTEDLKLICKFINNSDPIVAFYEETIKDFFPNSKEIITDTATLNSLVLKLGALQGLLFDEFNNAIPNGINTEEAARITASTEAITHQCEKIISKCNYKKV